ncbi:MAG: Mov34/MPN/PAD-1 family protein [Candidatus Odinarchaeia archaeon]
MSGVLINPVALAKILAHCTSANTEVAGLLLGRVVNKTLIIEDTFTGLQYGSQTHVKLSEYVQLKAFEKANNAGRIICGWYHSHPGMGANFMSRTDILTQQTYQKLLPESVALIVDPRGFKESMDFKELDIHVYRVSSSGDPEHVKFDLEINPENLIPSIYTLLKEKVSPIKGEQIDQWLLKEEMLNRVRNKVLTAVFGWSLLLFAILLAVLNILYLYLI